LRPLSALPHKGSPGPPPHREFLICLISLLAQICSSQLHSQCFKSLSAPICSFYFFSLTSACSRALHSLTALTPCPESSLTTPQKSSMMLSYEPRPSMSSSIPQTSDHLPLSTSASKLTNGASLTNGHTTKNKQPATTHHHIWLITGPAGCGKSTVAQFIAKTMNLPYIEGDEVLTALNLYLTLLITHSTTQQPTSIKWLRASRSATLTAGTG
jgi:hypothetical protein